MTKKIRLIHSNQLPAVDYAYVSFVPRDKDLLFLAGTCPLDSEGKVPENFGFKEQAKLCVENLETLLAELGAMLEDIAYTRVLVASPNQRDLVDAWNVIRKEFGDHDVPSTLTGVTVLGYTHQLVEIEAVVAVDSLDS